MNQELGELIRGLNRLFWVLTALAVGFLVLGYVVHRAGIPAAPPVGELRSWGIFLLILSVVMGVAAPILLRTLFNRRAVDRKKVTMGDFAAHQRRLVVVPICAGYAAGFAYLLMVPNLYLYGSVLAGLYGIYSALPQERKLKGEMRYYGLDGK